MADGAGERDVRLDPQLDGASHQALALGAVPDQDQARPPLIIEQERKRLEKILHPVPGLEASREHDDGVARFARPRALRARHRLLESLEIHGIGKEVDPLAAAAQASEPITQGGGDAKQRVCPAREESLDLNGHPAQVQLAIAGLLLDERSVDFKDQRRGKALCEHRSGQRPERVPLIDHVHVARSKGNLHVEIPVRGQCGCLGRDPPP